MHRSARSTSSSSIAEPFLPLFERDIRIVHVRKGVPAPGTDEIVQGTAVCERHEHEQRRDRRREALGNRRLEPRMMVRDDVGMLNGFKEVYFPEDSK